MRSILPLGERIFYALYKWHERLSGLLLVVARCGAEQSSDTISLTLKMVVPSRSLINHKMSVIESDSRLTLTLTPTICAPLIGVSSRTKWVSLIPRSHAPLNRILNLLPTISQTGSRPHLVPSPLRPPLPRLAFLRVCLILLHLPPNPAPLVVRTEGGASARAARPAVGLN